MVLRYYTVLLQKFSPLQCNAFCQLGPNLQKVIGNICKISLAMVPQYSVLFFILFIYFLNRKELHFCWRKQS